MEVILCKQVESLGKVGDVVKVKVLSVEAERKRIALTMRLSDDSRNHQHEGSGRSAKSAAKTENHQNNGRNKPKSAPQSTLADAFRRAKR